MHFASRLIVTGLTVSLSHLALTSALHAQDQNSKEEVAEATPVEPIWFFNQSDVAVDPSYVFGQLPNGMRYILRENATPAGTALVRMRINSGSLEETESERGLSHFLEHMAFNGSKNIPEGEMIALLEREGLAFGADTNASTGLEAITYMLNLPRNDEELLDTALMLMRETASELTITQDAVDRERGVVLAERRDRRGFAQRAREDGLEFLAPGARFLDRMPIGTQETLENATAAQMRALYARTYTPSNTVLVIIGDYPVEVMENALKARFSDWQGNKAPTDPVSGPVIIERAGEADIYLDPALSESVGIMELGPWLDEPDSLENRRLMTLRSVGTSIINRRLARLARGEDAPFRSARVSGSSVFEDARTSSLSVNSEDGEWRKGMLAALREVNQALTYGFTEAEVAEQVANLRTAAENAVAAEATQSNNSLTGRALSLIANDWVPVSPSQRLEMTNEFLPHITPQSVISALRDVAIPFENPLIRFQGRTAPEGGEAALRAAFDEGMALAIAPPQEAGVIEFAYGDFGQPGEVISDTREERLGLRYITFANGVRLTLKQTDVREDRVSYRMRIDGGNLMNTRDDPLKTYLVGSIPAGGLGQHSADELQSVLAGRSVGFRMSNSADGINMSGGTTPRDLQLQLQLLTAGLTDPGYRNEGLEQFRRSINNFYATLRSTPSRAYGSAAGAILSDNDPRFSLAEKEQFFALDYEKLQEAIGDRLDNGAIELALVGDFDEEQTIAAVAATLGTLPLRETEFRQRNEARQRSFTSQRGEQIIRHLGEDDQAMVRLIWPTTDDHDFQESIRVSLLARVVQLELTDRLREELGQAYSPRASSSMSKTYPNYGTFSVSASVDAAQIEATQAAIGALIEELRDKPVDQDTLNRARQPMLEAFDNALKSLGGWMNLADRAQSEPERLERWFDGPEALNDVTPQDIQAAAQKYLLSQGAVEFLVLPEQVEEATE